MVWLHDGAKGSNIRLFVSTEYTNVTDRQTDTARRQAALMHSIARQKLIVTNRNNETRV